MLTLIFERSLESISNVKIFFVTEWKLKTYTDFQSQLSTQLSQKDNVLSKSFWYFKLLEPLYRNSQKLIASEFSKTSIYILFLGLVFHDADLDFSSALL